MSEIDIQEYISKLTIEKQQLANEGKYLEAEKIRKKIQDLKESNLSSKKKEIKNTFSQDLKNLQENYDFDISTHNQNWDNTLNEFDIRARSQAESINEKHNKEIEILILNFNENYPCIKYSKDYLDTKNIEMNLVKQDRFVEAHQIKLKLEGMEQMELAKYEKEKNEKLKIKLDILYNKHTLESNAFKQKLDNEYDELNIKKNTELEKINLQFKKKKMELELHHKSEVNTHSSLSTLRSKNVSMKLINNSMNNTIMRLNNEGFSKSGSHQSKLRLNEDIKSSIFSEELYENDNNEKVNMGD